MEVTVSAGRLVCCDHGYRSTRPCLPCFFQEAVVPGQTEDIINMVVLAPVHEVFSGKPAVAADQDGYIGPATADHFDDTPYDIAGPAGAVDIARAELGEQQVMAAEDIERQETTVLVIAMEEAVVLMTMGLNVGGINIQGDVFRWYLVTVEKQVCKQAGQFLQVGHHLVIAPVAALP